MRISPVTLLGQLILSLSSHLFKPEFPGLKDLEEFLKEEEQLLPLKNESPLALPREVTLLRKECGYYFPFKPRVVLW